MSIMYNRKFIVEFVACFYLNLCLLMFLYYCDVSMHLIVSKLLHFLYEVKHCLLVMFVAFVAFVAK